MIDSIDIESSLNEKLIDSVQEYIVTYADTSNKKDVRLTAVGQARQLLEYICNALEPDNYVASMMHKGFCKILVKAVKAEKYPDDLQDFKQEIAFLYVINDK